MSEKTLQFDNLCKIKNIQKKKISRMKKEIKTLKEQLASEIKQREKAEKVIIDLMDNTPHYDECSFMEDENCKCDCGREIDIKLARQYFAEKEKQNKENKDEK